MVVYTHETQNEVTMTREMACSDSPWWSTDIRLCEGTRTRERAGSDSSWWSTDMRHGVK